MTSALSPSFSDVKIREFLDQFLSHRHVISHGRPAMRVNRIRNPNLHPDPGFRRLTPSTRPSVNRSAPDDPASPSIPV
ncbi:hypothetical protein M404DRAFT_998579 [Pisolithus tinctorius Marx 270]|uniref:Uncharacterized protein n=1 Tax=Pisolithus tinctorius Marx 270 TaxID=870435 RepID=A0A0C3PGT7_PISTI|nr:hypothetical protein M404DRAFT_998579 [Pisolithus tinctorius Marx 270]